MSCGYWTHPVAWVFLPDAPRVIALLREGRVLTLKIDHDSGQGFALVKYAARTRAAIGGE